MASLSYLIEIYFNLILPKSGSNQLQTYSYLTEADIPSCVLFIDKTYLYKNTTNNSQIECEIRNDTETNGQLIITTSWTM